MAEFLFGKMLTTNSFNSSNSSTSLGQLTLSKYLQNSQCWLSNNSVFSSHFKQEFYFFSATFTIPPTKLLKYNCLLKKSWKRNKKLALFLRCLKINVKSIFRILNLCDRLREIGNIYQGFFIEVCSQFQSIILVLLKGCVSLRR